MLLKKLKFIKNRILPPEAAMNYARSISQTTNIPMLVVMRSKPYLNYLKFLTR